MDAGARETDTLLRRLSQRTLCLLLRAALNGSACVHVCVCECIRVIDGAAVVLQRGEEREGGRKRDGIVVAVNAEW